jgi:hypothetical protein
LPLINQGSQNQPILRTLTNMTNMTNSISGSVSANLSKNARYFYIDS